MNFYLKAFLILLLISFTGFGVHYLIVDHPVIPLWKTYLFLGAAAFVTVSALKYVFELVPDKLGFAFLALVFIKFGIVLILFPELITGPSLSRVEVLGFLIPYFIFLFLEATIVIKWLNKK